MIGATFDVDTTPLVKGGLPIIRYLPGAPPVGVHGDKGETGLIPNVTLVLYLTDGGASPTSGQTFFPDLSLAVSPQRGAVLSFENLNPLGVPEPRARHGVSAVAASQKHDRLVVQIPIVYRLGERRGTALPEHVSGSKHMIHLGMMGIIAVGVVTYYLWTWMTGDGIECDSYDCRM